MTSTRVNPCSSVAQFPVTGGLVLARPGVDGLYLLNSSAAFIWEQLSQDASPSQIVTNLAEAFQIPKEIAHKDVHSTLDHWETTLLSEPQINTDIRRSKPPIRPHPCSSVAYFLNKPFKVTLDSQELADEINPRLTHLRASHQEKPEFTLTLTTVEDQIHLHCGDEFLSAEPNVSAARAILLQEIVRRATTPPRQWLALFHAGACGNDHSCVIFPAASYSGKTTLAAVLMQRGLTFYADDSVALEKETLEIPAMPFGLSIREGSWPLLGSRTPGFDNLPVTQRFGQQVRFVYPPVRRTSAQAAAIVFPNYQPGAEPKIRPLSTLDTLIQLKQSGFWVENQTESIAAFADWLEPLPSYQITYAAVDQAANLIAALLS